MRNLFLGFLLGLAVTVSAQEVVNLTTPVSITRSTFRLKSVYMESLDTATPTVNIQWLGNDGALNIALYPTPAPQGSSQPSGATLFNVLNTSNLSINSFVKRAYQRLQADGYIAAGTISGTPQ